MSTLKYFAIGMKIIKDNSNISYWMFAGDCLIFCKATKWAAREMEHILKHYKKVLGQLINYHKFKIQFHGSSQTVK